MCTSGYGCGQVAGQMSPVVREDVILLSRAFADRKIGRGDKVMLLSDNRYAWIVTDLALMALGAISAAQSQGLRVGDDIAITGFDDIPMAEHTHPPLTTVHQPIYHIGGMVCEMLIHLLRNAEVEEEHILLQPTLMVRQSCGSKVGKLQGGSLLPNQTN